MIFSYPLRKELWFTAAILTFFVVFPSLGFAWQEEIVLYPVDGATVAVLPLSTKLKSQNGERLAIRLDFDSANGPFFEIIAIEEKKIIKKKLKDYSEEEKAKILLGKKALYSHQLPEHYSMNLEVKVDPQPNEELNVVNYLYTLLAVPKDPLAPSPCPLITDSSPPRLTALAEIDTALTGDIETFFRTFKKVFALALKQRRENF